MSKEQSDKEGELIEIFSKDGEPLGKKVTREEAHKKGIWHSVIHVWISDSKGNLILQKRSKNKKSNPGLYDTSCAGHIVFGQKPLEGAITEIKEELGINIIDPSDLHFIGKFAISQKKNNNTYMDNEFYFTYAIEIDKITLKDLTLQKCEVDGVALMHHTNVRKMFEKKNKHFVKRNVKSK